MALTKLSILGLMMATALFALDLAAFKALLFVGLGTFSWECLVLLAVLPTVNALLIGLSLLVRQVARQGVGAPFLVGSQAVGWPAVATVLIAKFGFDEHADRYQTWARRGLTVVWIDYVKWTGEFTHAHWREIHLVFDVLALAVPPLILATLGGLIAARLQVAVVRCAEPGVYGRAISTRHARAALVAALLVLGVGVWAAKVRGRWLIYDRQVRGAIVGEPIARRQYARALAELRSLQQDTDKLSDDPGLRASRLKSLAESAETHRRWMKRCADLRKLYEPAARRPWLPIPPNPPLSPSVRLWSKGSKGSKVARHLERESMAGEGASLCIGSAPLKPDLSAFRTKSLPGPCGRWMPIHRRSISALLP